MAGVTCKVHGPKVDERKWHPEITLDMVQDYDASIKDADDICNLIVVPDGFTGLLSAPGEKPRRFSPGPPKGVSLNGREEEEGHGGDGGGP